ncbi:TM9 protein C [Cavenderia fasciculata]|uniref:Transmembrane 9 superfamily member n=1 Tax=Cavenderia fasciculata TaxID=261658 RepID=F4PJI2_CACFS|nr:TM9 protein C [Cavenderia fasciculata]EGG23756.1 TM9 protein C [Cavenderia fasciculata]|eukprot:XP_004361607.1 TM9 protein C [Cavenderia fasciculata]
MMGLLYTRSSSSSSSFKSILLTVFVLIVSSILLNSSNNQVEARILSNSNPTVYHTGDTVNVKANRVKSGLVSLDYYQAPFPKPNTTVGDSGSFIFKLSGNRKYDSLYDIPALVSLNCSHVGNTSYNVTSDQVNSLIDYIDNRYRVFMYIDDLPIGEKYSNHIEIGYDIGYLYRSYNGNKTNTVYYLNNHLNIHIEYTNSSSSSGGAEIVGVYVVAHSVNSNLAQECQYSSSESSRLILEQDKPLINMAWTYRVTWTNVTDKTWATRWDAYYPYVAAVEAPSIALSFFNTAILAVPFIMILFRVFRNENTLGGFVEMMDSGWKSIYADVFRSPKGFMTLSVIVGSGIQIATTSFIVMLFYVGGLLSIANDGAFTMTAVIVFAFCAVFGGYASMRTYIMLGGTRKRYNAVLNATFVSFVVLILLMIANTQLWSHKYTTAPSGGLVAIVIVLFIFMSIPLSLASSYFVNSWPPAGYPCHTNSIPRMIPKRKFYQNPYIMSAILGFIPFININVPITIYLNSMFFDLHYSASFATFIAVTLLFVNVLLVNVLIEFYQLSIEDYNWWWRSVVGPTFTALYIFIKMLVFGFSNFGSIATQPKFYYFMFSLVTSLMSALLFSAVGFLGNLYFTKRIYSTLHFD